MTTTSHESAWQKRDRERERERQRERGDPGHNDSERIVTLPLVARETGAIMRYSRSFAWARDRLFAYDSREMSGSDRIGKAAVSGD